MSDDSTREDRAVAYVLGDLDPAEAAAFERELATDTALAAEVRELRRALAALPYATITEPPRDLRARVLTAAGRNETRSPRAAHPTSAPRNWWPTAITALAAGLALYFAFDARHVRRELALEREVTALLQQPNVVVGFALAGTGNAAGAYGNVALDMDAAKGALALTGLPTAPTGQVYRLWARSAGKDVLCGQFTADANQAARTQFIVPVRAYEGRIERLFVTLEPLADTPQPTGPRVLESL
jgi:anti-sigma-K factor RskA